MTRLAQCDGKWVLFKCGREYWYVNADLTYGCLNSQSKDYNAINALGYLEQWGKATYVRPTIKSC